MEDMAAQCRANNPDECRIHGTNGKWDRLQRVADHAAKTGDTNQYIAIRAEMDALTDDEVKLELPSKLYSDEAVIAAASSKWTSTGWEKVPFNTKKLALQDARAKLDVAAPYFIKGRVTNSAITAVAKHSWEARENGSWNKASMNDRDAYMHAAQRFLKRAEPHLTKM